MPLLALLAVLTILVAPDAARAQPQSGGEAAVSLAPTSGPVGARVTVSGVRFTPGATVEVGYTTTDCSSMTVIDGARGTVGKDRTVTIGVVWPQTGMGSFTICVRDKNSGKSYPSTDPYQVLSGSPPALTVNPSPATSQGQVTVSGANFLPSGASVEVLWGPVTSGGAARGNVCANHVAVKSTDSTGKFTLTFSAPFASSDTPITVIAVSPQGSCGSSPVLAAQQNITVRAAASATATASAAVKPVNPSGFIWPPTGIWSVVYCLVGLLLFLLLLLALLVASRHNNKSQPAVVNQQRGQGGQGNQAGGRLMGSTQVSMGADGRPSASEQFYAQGRRGATHIATVEDTMEEQPMPPLQGAGGNPPTSRYGPQ